MVAELAVKLNPDNVPPAVLGGALKFNVGVPDAVGAFKLKPPGVLASEGVPNVAPNAGGFVARIKINFLSRVVIKKFSTRILYQSKPSNVKRA